MNTPRVSKHEVFTVLESHDYFKGFEKRYKVSSVANRVADILNIPYSSPNLREIVQEYFHAYKSAKWRMATDMEFRDGRLGEYMEIEGLRIYWLQSGKLWDNIRGLLEEFNIKNETSLPLHRDGVARQFCQERTIKIEELWGHLGLRLPIGMTDGESQAENLRWLWRICLNMSTSNNVNIPLRKRLLDIPNSIKYKEYHKKILQTLQRFKGVTGVDLGTTSWATLSRRINAFDYNHITVEDFHKFISNTEKTETTPLRNIDQIMLQYLRDNPDKFYHPKGK